MSSITIGHSSVCVVDMDVVCDLPPVNVRQSDVKRAIDGIRQRDAGPLTFSSSLPQALPVLPGRCFCGLNMEMFRLVRPFLLQVRDTFCCC